MAKIGIGILLIFWMATTLCLVCSIVGLVLFVRDDSQCENFQGDEGMSSWMRVGHSLLNKL